MLLHACRNLLLLSSILLIVTEGFAAPTDQSIVVTTTQVPNVGGKAKDSEANNDPASTVPQIYQMLIKSNVTNRFAHTTIVSKVKNLQDHAQEADFSVVLPENAFISGFIMEIGGKNYTAYVKEKEEAKKIYDEAVSSGIGAAHVAVSARDSNTFTVSTNIEPEAKAVFYLDYAELLKRRAGRYELVINIHPGQPVKDMRVEVLINETRKLTDVKTPPLRSGNDIGSDKEDLDPRADIRKVDDYTAAVTFGPSVQQQKEYAKELGTKEQDGFAGQFVVQYDVERDPSGGEVLIKDGYFVHFFAPSELPPLPKHLIFVLDTSGSMYADKINQLIEAMQKILEQLKESDIFHLVEFNSVVKVWSLDDESKSTYYPDNKSYRYERTDKPLGDMVYPEASVANSDNIKKAKKVVSALSADGGTDIHSAIKVALHLVALAKANSKSDNSHQPIIIFLTDGEPTVGESNNEKIINEITEFNSEERKSPIFSLSFGYGADRKFLEKLALKNLGFNKHIYEAADASLQLQDFYKQVSSPLLSDVTFKYEPTTFSDLTITDFPLHFGGSELVVCGFYRSPNPTELNVTAKGKRGLITFKPIIQRSVSDVERLWAYLTIKQLLDKQEIGKNETTKRKALDLSLKYSFVTSVTSLVVVKPNETSAVDTEESGKKKFPMYPLQAAAPPSFSNFAHSAYAGLAGPSGHRGGSSAVYSANRGAFLPHSRGPYHSPTMYSSNKALSVPSWPASGASYLPKSTTVADFYDADRIVSGLFSENAAVSDPSDIFTTLPWLKQITNEAGFITAKNGSLFNLGLNETLANERVACNETPFNSTGECRLIKDCPQVFSELTTSEKYFQFFCELKGFAGVCCPKEDP